MSTLEEIEAATEKLTHSEKVHLFGYLTRALSLSDDIAPAASGGTLGDLIQLWGTFPPDPEFADDLERVSKSDSPAPDPWA